jgi:hypothetical protein
MADISSWRRFVYSEGSAMTDQLVLFTLLGIWMWMQVSKKAFFLSDWFNSYPAEGQGVGTERKFSHHLPRKRSRQVACVVTMPRKPGSSRYLPIAGNEWSVLFI